MTVRKKRYLVTLKQVADAFHLSIHTLYKSEHKLKRPKPVYKNAGRISALYAWDEMVEWGRKEFWYRRPPDSPPSDALYES